MIAGRSVTLAGSFDSDLEWLAAGDVKYFSGMASAELPVRSGEFTLQFGWQKLDIDYQSAGFPIDIVTENAERSEQYYSTKAQWAKWIFPRLQSKTALLADKGWGSHTLVWLDEYYRQVWQGRTLAGDTYEVPDPGSLGLSQTLRWDYAPGAAQLLTTLSWKRREIAPGYEFEVEGEHAGELVRGISGLTDLSLDLSSENSLHSRLKLRNGFNLSKTTDRDLRLTLLSGANIALNEYWTLRLNGAYVREASAFDARKFELQFVREFSTGWAVFGGGSYYNDSGEIEQSNLITDANPELKSVGWTVGVVWNDVLQQQSFRFTVGNFDQEFADDQLDQRFKNLYTDRTWWLFRVGYTFEF